MRNEILDIFGSYARETTVKKREGGAREVVNLLARVINIHYQREMGCCYTMETRKIMSATQRSIWGISYYFHAQ